MARQVRDIGLETRSGRLKLDRKDGPYFWRQMSVGAFVGYRKLNPKAGKEIAGNWYVRYLHNVTKTYKKKKLATADDYADENGTTILNFRQAQAEANKVIDADQTPNGYTVSDAIDGYILSYKKENSPSKRTLKTTLSVINKHIKPELGRLMVNDLEFGHLNKWRLALAPDSDEEDEEERYEIERKRKASANRVLTYLKAMLNYAYANIKEIKDDSAWRKLKPFKNVGAENVRPLSLSEVKRLLNACDPDFRLLVRAALYTGCRYGELITMKVNAFDSVLRRVIATKRTAKNSVTRQMSLNEDGLIFFKQVIAGKIGKVLIFLTSEGEAWGDSQQKRRMDDACEIAKIEPAATFHNLRDTYASILVSEGVPMRSVADLLGHSDTRITERCYAQFQQSVTDKLVMEHLPSFGVEDTNVEVLK